MAHLLVVDDEPSICWGLSKLARDMGHSVAAAATAEQGLELARASRPDAIVLDVRLPGMDGLAAMERFRGVLGTVPIIIVTAYGDLSTAVKAVRNGAFEYLVKPFELKAAQRAIRRALEQAAAAPSAAPPAHSPSGEQLVGSTPVMQEVFKRIAVVAPSTACVHVHGESGTGKEVVARAIHRYSRRAAGPFVSVNVASLSPTVIESELFGHVRGAFTGADQPRKGLLEQAHGGTIFFDEVADIPLALQVKLLRVLEYGEFQPVGSDQTLKSDFRVISATHRDLAGRVGEGSFRHDLYFRLVTFEIELPPLRDRRPDIGPLAEYFLDLLAARDGRARPALSPEVLAELECRPWFGNVRELRNAVEHAMILARGGTILPEHLPQPAPPVAPGVGDESSALASLIGQWAHRQLADDAESTDLYERFLKLVEPPLLEAVLGQSRGQCAAAARRLGLHRTTLRKRLDDLGIDAGPP
jgi:two-component system nitrogen regulation response regulator GlnG